MAQDVRVHPLPEPTRAVTPLFGPAMAEYQPQAKGKRRKKEGKKEKI